MTNIDGTNSYLFNANNMRVKKTTQSGIMLYGWDNDRIFAEYDGSGTAIQETVYFGSTPIALLKDNATYRVFADQIDTPRVLADNTNATLWAWNSKPFGESQPDEDVDGDSTNLSYNLRFPGQYFDGETGKHYNFNRDYNPLTGRYAQSDPIGLDGGMNTYLYTDANLLIRMDPDGKFWNLIARGVYLAGNIAYKTYKKLPCLVYRLVDCKGSLVYIGISKTPHVRMYAHRSWLGVIGKYGCQGCCEVKMYVMRGYKQRYKCTQSEKKSIKYYKPIWNTQHSPYSATRRNALRDAWKTKNCW